MQLNDDLVEQARRGDQDALGEIYRHLAPRVLRYLAVRGADDPEALTNDVFLAVIPRIADVTGGASGTTALVFRIAHSRYVDDVRRKARRPAAVEYEMETDPRQTDAAETEALGNLAHEAADRLIRTLKPEHAATLSLRIVADLSLAETAAALGKSVGAVKQLQRRALESLKASIEDGGRHHEQG